MLSLVGLAIALLTSLISQPVQAQVRDSQVYTWSYAGIDNSQKVCEKIEVHPRNRAVPASSHKVAVKVRSIIVDNHYCQ
ncbi:hypothetical protein IQ249_06310 [Lusitaniella coriacea LEGE 07157]|uniref:Uncharacterized protein n=1 Tax=Lusitaniella coriacea LEGE 07157 TaxID=945747 RepID=A0A8J7J695_9CYAN|nr:hypothetical protein [Lusitaniella coriacea]MBE9115510.1 hypothetical protein [Lusitaniella coriacea LEGE 07157]